MLPAEASALHAVTNVMSNGARPATVIYDEREVFYDVGVHLQASERGRRPGIARRFPDSVSGGSLVSRCARLGDDRPVGRLLRSRGHHDEIVLRHIMRPDGRPAGHLQRPRAGDLSARAQGLQTGRPGMLMMAKHNDEFLDDSYERRRRHAVQVGVGLFRRPPSAAIHKIETARTRRCPRHGPPDLGDDKEVYRWNFLIENNRARDDTAR